MDVLSAARRVIDEGPVCDACLGRQFADRSFGLSNTERGHSLRMAVALEDDEDFEGFDESGEECWVCEGLTNDFEKYAEQVAAALSGIDFETYQVGTRTPPLIEENEALLRNLADLPEDTGELFKSEYNREVGKRVGKLTETEVDFDRPDVLALLNLERGDVDVQINPAFVFGRYRKLERDIPQTEWPCRECGGSGKQLAEGGGEEPCDYCGGDGYLYSKSVEELTTPPVLDAMEGKEALFHGAGREDVDALMLGTGRPFVIEIKKPKQRTPDTKTLETEINEFADEQAEVEGLRLATHEMVERVKELDASKTYRAQVEFDAPVTEGELDDAIAELRGATIEQYTPNRVDHRRANLTRVREVYDIDGHLDDETHGEVEIHGEGGLYIKELVSGDDGRTEPSLAGLLGVDTEVTALDVIGVEGEDEAFDEDEYLRE
ncbi:tRNA pseudouridine synthase 10 [Haladaptatus litoreus]|uniref:tRNA pseudouridine synthase Pus10 n=1 Tax=Haladaptatus litoreus TaxID=553468 RepID=A0A1N6ZUR9_9EURY|nr:tRNA pseudouridine(54/55) synthase Pus10 [Haladaptatus litoreus]SIR30573.1 tRNA pseudouridine synthase 10 [Haladaptatus litoreus]